MPGLIPCYTMSKLWFEDKPHSSADIEHKYRYPLSQHVNWNKPFLSFCQFREGLFENVVLSEQTLPCRWGDISLPKSKENPFFFIVYWLLAVDQLLLSMKPKMTYLRRFLLLVLLTWRTWIWEKLLGCWVQTILGISYAGLGREKPRLLPVRLDTDGLKLSCTLKVVGCDGFGGGAAFR